MLVDIWMHYICNLDHILYPLKKEKYNIYFIRKGKQNLLHTKLVPVEFTTIESFDSFDPLSAIAEYRQTIFS